MKCSGMSGAGSYVSSAGRSYTIAGGNLFRLWSFCSQLFFTRRIIFSVFSYSGRLEFINCPRFLIGDILVVVWTKCAGYLADGNGVFNSVPPKFNILPVYDDDAVGSQSLWKELCIAFSSKTLSWGSC